MRRPEGDEAARTVKGGAQILFSFPDVEPEGWRVPAPLCHMDAPFYRRDEQPRAAKLFSVVEFHRRAAAQRWF